MGAFLAFMGIIVGMLVLVGGLLFIVNRAEAPPKPHVTKLERKYRKLNEDADSILRSLLVPESTEDFDILTPESREKIVNWRKDYRKVIGED